MKRCPECRRDYYDETLRYCLDDGTALLEGPSTADQPTAIISGGNDSDDRVTRRFAETTVEPPPRMSHDAYPARNKSISFVAAATIVAMLAGTGFLIYRYRPADKDAP